MLNPEVQEPSWQPSPEVQGSPSSQGAGVGSKEHPISESQLSVVQGLPSSQSTSLPPEHSPERQIVSFVQ